MDREATVEMSGRAGGPERSWQVFRWGLLSFLIAACLAAGHAPDARAQDGTPSEYQVKAAFLYNFAKFVEWPDGDFADAGAPLVIGILGEDPFGDAIDEVIKGKMVNGRPLVIRRLKQTQSLGTCHILFISSSEKKRLGQIVEDLRMASVLTVGEAEAFVQAGGIVGFVMEDGRVRFEINADGAERAQLRVSSKLMALAKVIRNGQSRGKD